MSKFRLRGRRKRTKGEAKRDRIPVRAIIPNMVTSLAACAGITSISLASEGRFTSALGALLVACICDGMDGRIARLLKASSKLGAELDSLADFVNFGVAPAMFMFFWLTGGPAHTIGGEAVAQQTVRLVLGSALFYALCDCFRLARFNTMLEQPPVPYWKNYFTGVPAPGGCWMVLSPAMLAISLDAKGRFPMLAAFLQNPYFGMAMLLFVGSLMASRIPTISLKSLHIPKKALRPLMAAILLAIAFLWVNTWLTLAVVGIGYIASVPLTAWCFARTRERYLKSNPSGACASA
ncbi:MAG: phosphatidylcholine/phosphatidylserine synthase [Kiritimatiellae bacterium]|nr:phosphatidylcholine/phosphatidylserine synthase [Kiritimatiellia bacterium]